MVVMFCRSDPPPGSVSAIVARISPVAIARQVALLLLLGAEQRQQLGHHGMPAHRAGQAHPAAGQFLRDLT